MTTPDTPTLAHTAEEALARFQLVEGEGDGEHTACVVSAASWMAGEAFSDQLDCAHPNLRSMVIVANDADGTTPQQRAEMLRAAETGLIDTWWVPGLVLAHAFARPKPPEGEELEPELAVDRALRVLAYVSAWKPRRERPSANLTRADLYGANLTGADLTRADLYGANLTGANLTRANLTGADLTRANLTGADLTGAYLPGANLTGANLTGANLTGAYLTGANLTRADLYGANLTGAYLTGAYLPGAYLTGANLTRAYGTPMGGMPDGWTLDDAGWWVKS